MAIKAWVAIWIVLLSVEVFVEVAVHRLFESRGLLTELRRVL
jgi:hypothetical protein